MSFASSIGTSKMRYNKKKCQQDYPFSKKGYVLKQIQELNPDVLMYVTSDMDPCDIVSDKIKYIVFDQCIFDHRIMIDCKNAVIVSFYKCNIESRVTMNCPKLRHIAINKCKIIKNVKIRSRNIKKILIGESLLLDKIHVISNVKDLVMGKCTIVHAPAVPKKTKVTKINCSLLEIKNAF